MPVDRGGEYGVATPLPSGAPIVGSDAELRALVLEARAAGTAPPVVGLVGGDLCRTLGGRGDRIRLASDDARTVPVDLGTVVLDGEPTVFVAHLVIGRPFAGGTLVAQAQWLGDLDIGPRSHPGDGRLDITTGRVRFTERRAARRRARSGTHLPHPGLRHDSVRTFRVESARPVGVTADGIALGRHRRFEIGIEPDALHVVV